MSRCRGATTALATFVVVLAGACAVAGPAVNAEATAAQPDAHWVSAWGTAQQLAPDVMPEWTRPPPVPDHPLQSPIPPTPEHLVSQTVRMVVRTTIAGRRVRIRLSNRFGARPVAIGAAHIALHRQGSAIEPGTDRVITVGGHAAFVLPPGATMLSDPVSLAVPAPAELTVSLYVHGDSGPLTLHPLGLHTTYVAKGDLTGKAVLPDARSNASYFWLSGVGVETTRRAGVIVALGDSITDGFRTTLDRNRDWPSVLSDRLRAVYPATDWAVLNMGYSGNRILRDGAGVSTLARLDRDVLVRAGATWIVLLDGINDIGWAALPGAPSSEQVTAQDLIAGDREIIERAHLHGIKVMGATLTPYLGVNTYSAQGEAIRQALNSWIRSGGAFDAVVDFDAVARDPAQPQQLRPEFDSGDHIHPNDAGNRAMAQAIAVKVFDPVAIMRRAQ